MKTNSPTLSKRSAHGNRPSLPSRFFRPSMANAVTFQTSRPSFLDTFNGSFWQPLRLDLLQAPLSRRHE